MSYSRSKLPYAQCAAALCRWFSANNRAMPWRETRDPYRIWLSEIMLQQTQVATVIPYYNRFVEHFPTVEALASAPLDDVLKFWAGLGYYSRARNLHRGAALVVERFGGKIPGSSEEIREIPGIGAYTAGAILSIAFSLPEPLVDGNVARVLSRLLLIKGDWRKGPMKERLWVIARKLVAESAPVSAKKGSRKQDALVSPGNLNQALMELGATVCTPKSPGCDRCPLAKFCLAKKKGAQADYPEISEKAGVPAWKLRAWIVEDAHGRILLAQRQASGLFGGLWEVPTERITFSDKRSSAPLIGKVTHVLSHRRLEINIHRDEDAGHTRWQSAAEFPCWSGQYTNFCWIDASEVTNGRTVGLASVQRKVLALALQDSVGLFARKPNEVDPR